MGTENRIKELRKQRGMSMRALAEAVGTSQQQIDRLEKGKRRLTLDWMEQLSRALGCDIMDMVPGSSPKQAEDVSSYRNMKAKVVGTIDSERGNRATRFKESEVYTVVFGRPQNVIAPRLFALVVAGHALPGFAEGTELVFAEADKGRPLSPRAGAWVLCQSLEKEETYYCMETFPVKDRHKLVRALLVKSIRNE